jgi:hypothetical protein
LLVTQEEPLPNCGIVGPPSASSNPTGVMSW